MSFKIYSDVENAVYRATADIDKYSVEKQKAIRAAVEAGCTAIRNQAIRMAPAGPSGGLKAGIRMDMSPKGASGTIRSTSPHSHFVEFGTGERIVYNRKGKKAMVINGEFVRGDIYNGRMTAKPFMRPALEMEKPAFEESVKKLLE